jgi:ParB family chromosome partitioning protein
MWANKVKPVNTDVDANKRNKNANDEYVTELDAKLLAPNPYQPRMDFNEETIKELAASIKEYGQLQPAVVCKRDDGQEGYYVVAGERRFRACKLLKRSLKCVIAPSMNIRELQLIAFQENVMRDNLHPVEIALAMQRLVETKVVEGWESFTGMTGLSGRTAVRYKSLVRLSRPAMKLAVESDYRDALVLETLNRRISGAAQAPILQKIIGDGLDQKRAVKYIKELARSEKKQEIDNLPRTKFNTAGAPLIAWNWKPDFTLKNAPRRQEAFQKRLESLLSDIKNTLVKEFGDAKESK